MRRLFVGAVFLPAIAMGQSVQGLVTERGTPAHGAIVTLERVGALGDSAREIRSVLVDERGSYMVGASSGGTYAILVRRIGARPFRSEAMALAAGESRRLDVALRANPSGSAFTLERVTVASATPCRTATDQGVRIADLWDNARTALHATAISTRDSLVRRRLIRYERSLEPATLAIRREEVRAFDALGGTNGGFFRSIPGDSLSMVGYWQRIGTGAARFHGPDENALLSPAFLTDHCFTLVESPEGDNSLVGLGFEPAEHRLAGDTPPEIRGTIWLDSATSELRSLDFTWVTLPPGVPAMNLGGKVEYSRLSWGPWFVRRWWLRMPEGLAIARETSAGRFAILEEGGLVQTADAIAGGAVPAKISGRITDGASHPLAGATITISGTNIGAASDGEGRFMIDSVPPGLQGIVAEHPRYEALGVHAAALDVLLDDGAYRELQLTAPTDAEIPSLLCGASVENGEGMELGVGVLRLIVVDQATGQPKPGLQVTLAERNAKVTGKGYIVHQKTDARGATLFCDAPAERLLVVTTAADSHAAVLELALPSAGMKARVLQLGRR